MSNEATKTRAIWGPDVMNLLRGQGIDIGCGPDPVLPHVDRFDFEQGDANTITRYVQKQYDFVFSSHTLEHMVDRYAALGEWFALVKPGGHLIVLVPDDDSQFPIVVAGIGERLGPRALGAGGNRQRDAAGSRLRSPSL
ncbi:MAG: hypothetical protein AUG04_10020 [Deltaproteobacteria bacterium 13_1_20CM_2_69_21]|nr:MAG: hypothetical protein AUG04_10020 [Deltaproteobacteria bacterium 13_1_20CM_2_69_21]